MLNEAMQESGLVFFRSDMSVAPRPAQLAIRVLIRVLKAPRGARERIPAHEI